jgi:chemotaxis protein histidine kinase CheA
LHTQELAATSVQAVVRGKAGRCKSEQVRAETISAAKAAAKAALYAQVMAAAALAKAKAALVTAEATAASAEAKAANDAQYGDVSAARAAARAAKAARAAVEVAIEVEAEAVKAVKAAKEEEARWVEGEAGVDATAIDDAMDGTEEAAVEEKELKDGVEAVAQKPAVASDAKAPRMKPSPSEPPWGWLPQMSHGEVHEQCVQHQQRIERAWLRQYRPEVGPLLADLPKLRGRLPRPPRKLAPISPKPSGGDTDTRTDGRAGLGPVLGMFHSVPASHRKANTVRQSASMPSLDGVEAREWGHEMRGRVGAYDAKSRALGQAIRQRAHRLWGL